jgi:small-conductance mechanosensitive channel
VIKSPIVNHTQRGRRRTTVQIGVAYGTDLDRATQVLVEAVSAVDGVLDSPPPEALVEAFGESSIDFAVRYWHPPSIAAMWRSRSDVAKAIERGLAAADITIPFPQRVIHPPPDPGDGRR